MVADSAHPLLVAPQNFFTFRHHYYIYNQNMLNPLIFLNFPDIMYCKSVFSQTFQTHCVEVEAAYV